METRDFQQNVLGWFGNNGRVFPWRCDGIEPAIGLITELLLRRTTAQQVCRDYATLVTYLKVYLSAGNCREELASALKPLGLHQQRLEAIESVAVFLNSRYGGVLPARLDKLLEIPHVGPYVANATRCFYFNQPAPVVDINVARLLGRFFGVAGNISNPVRSKIYWLLAAALTPMGLAKKAKEFNWGLLDFGALVCTVKEPKCYCCPLMLACSYRGNFSKWRGLNSSEKIELHLLRWEFTQVPHRLAELVGLHRVFGVEKVIQLIRAHDETLIEPGAISELDLRRFSVHKYCGRDVGREIRWIF